MGTARRTATDNFLTITGGIQRATREGLSPRIHDHEKDRGE
jgi:hypothetical protein